MSPLRTKKMIRVTSKIASRTIRHPASSMPLMLAFKTRWILWLSLQLWASQIQWWWDNLLKLVALPCPTWDKWLQSNNSLSISPSWCTNTSRSSIFSSNSSSNKWWWVRILRLIQMVPSNLSPVLCQAWCPSTSARWDSLEWCLLLVCPAHSRPWVTQPTTRESSEESCSSLSVAHTLSQMLASTTTSAILNGKINTNKKNFNMVTIIKLFDCIY